MKYYVIPVTAFSQNCTLIWCEVTKQAALVDPGGDGEKIKAEVTKMGVSISQILLTHGHLDHVGAAIEMATYYQVPIYGPHLDDAFLLENLPAQSQMFGFAECLPFTPTRWLVEGDTLQIGEVRLNVLHCPGHTPGHVVFFNDHSRLALVGDVLFKGGVGRSDFPGGNHQTLINSIFNKLLSQGDDVAFIPGHGPISTFGHERKTNPFLRQ